MKWNWRSELPHLSILAVMGALAAYQWGRLPESIPVHFGLDGRPDRWGGRFEGLALMPLLTGAIYVLLWFAPRFDPGRANYPGFAGSYAVIRLAVTALFAVIYGLMIQSFHAGRIASDHWLSVMLGGVMVVLGNQMGKLRPNWFVGVRTPWTLSSKLSWNRTHRLAGWLLVLSGFVFWIAAVARPALALVTGLATVSVAAAISVVYSYIVWRSDPDKTPPAGTLPAEEPRP